MDARGSAVDAPASPSAVTREICVTPSFLALPAFRTGGRLRMKLDDIARD
jgi:hypothetical protein